MSLLRQRPFRRFWLGFSGSQTGSAITTLALPLAALAAGGGPLGAGLATTATYIPVVVATPVAGVLVDHYSVLRVARVTDLLRAGAIGLLPVCALLFPVPLWLILVAAFVAGALKGVGDVAHQSMLPTIVDPADVVAGNAFLSSSTSVSTVLGPAIGGAVMQVLAPVKALALDAVSFLFSWLMLGGIVPTEPAPTEPAPTEPAPTGGRSSVPGVLRSWWASLLAGFALLRRDQVLLGLGIAGGGSNLFAQCFLTGFIVFATQRIGLRPGALGLIFAVGAAGGLLGAVLSRTLARRYGPGTIMSLGMLSFGAGPLLVGLLAGHLPRAGTYAVLVLGILLYEAGVTGYNVQGVSQRQLRAPRAVLGRMTAAYRMLAYGSIPLGSALAGVLATAAGPRVPVLVAGVGVLGWYAVLLLSPLRVAFVAGPVEPSPILATTPK
jgi:MFS family permease